MTNPLLELKTIESFSDHGSVRRSVEDDIPQARAELAALEKVGISYDQVTRQLQDLGVQRFADSFHKLFEGIEAKKKAIEEKQATH